MLTAPGAKGHAPLALVAVYKYHIHAVSIIYCSVRKYYLYHSVVVVIPSFDFAFDYPITHANDRIVVLIVEVKDLFITPTKNGESECARSMIAITFILFIMSPPLIKLRR